MADINKLIEQFAAGVKSSVREDATTGNLEGFEDFSLSSKPKAAFVSAKDIDPGYPRQSYGSGRRPRGA